MILSLFFGVSQAAAECRGVVDNGKVKISRENLSDLRELGLDRERVFEILQQIASHETTGCWAHPSGNFDDQIISVGAMQWNYGQGSLQKLLRSFKRNWGAQFTSVRDRLMPTYGKLVFSKGCLMHTITKQCKDALLANQTNRKLDRSIAHELTRLFESDAMIQIQVDDALRIITSTKTTLLRAFPDQEAPSSRQVHWAIDVHVQRGSLFDGEGITEVSDLMRVRSKLSDLTDEKIKKKLLAIVTWYEGHCNSLDQDGVRWDCDYNVKKWTDLIRSGKLDAEQIELLFFTYLKDRTASTKAGLYQADAFQRRATIIFGTGSVHGSRK